MGYITKAHNETELDMDRIIYKFTNFDDSRHVIILVATYGVNGSSRLINSTTVITAGKQGRTLYEQGIAEMNSKHTKRINRNDYRDTIAASINEVIVNPMLAKNYRTLFINREKELSFKNSTYYCVQPKYDGERAIISIRDGEIEIHGRRGVLFENLTHLYDNIREFNLIESVEFLDGELIVEGESFQNIHSIIHSDDITETNKITFMAFDMFNITNLKMPYIDRYAMLADRFENTASYELEVTEGIIDLVPTYDIHSTDEMKILHDQFVGDKFEGIIIRYTNSPYVFGRSSGLLKWKYQEEHDYKIVGATAASSGREKNAIIWMCETSDGDIFNIRPRGSIVHRVKLYADVTKHLFRYIGKILQVYHEGYSDAGIPRNPRSGLVPKVA